VTASVLISTSSFGAVDPSPLERLRASGLSVEISDRGRQLSEPEVTELLAGKAGLIAGTEPLTRAVMLANPKLRVISRVGAGLDNIDLEAAGELGIQVYSTPAGPALAVAELALALMLDVLRGISRADRRIRAGIWEKEYGCLLSGKVVGIVGYGSVGRALGRLLGGFDCQLIVYDPLVPCAAVDDGGIVEQMASLEQLLAGADIVSLHCARCEQTLGLLDGDRMRMMKRGAVLVNTSRGGIVDEDALAKALDSGRLAGAGLDVFGNEPYEGPLRGRDDVVLTPHVGGYAAEARIRMEADAAANLLLGLGIE
jgi:D-3-phosphoglycerate dehydrogenase